MPSGRLAMKPKTRRSAVHIFQARAADSCERREEEEIQIENREREVYL